MSRHPHHEKPASGLAKGCAILFVVFMGLATLLATWAFATRLLIDNQ